ncbi:MAG: cytochrome c1 [Candidatus Pacebacteria bacterium]|nr:cytochrome c1 [Candidatus Paceibacterota bacterium]
MRQWNWKIGFASLTVLGLVFLSAQRVGAAESTEPVPQDWSFDGPFGKFDRAALQRGYQVYKEVCSACHSMNLLSFRNLGGGAGFAAGDEESSGPGFSAEQIKALAASFTVKDGPNDQGEFFDRPGRASDRFVAPFANEQAARSANNGALPPDLSVIVKAREGGADYIYGLLTGYKTPPADVILGAGMNYNIAFAGQQIAMAQPLNDNGVTFADGTKASVEQQAHDVVQFLTWAAEPNLETRHRMGISVLIYLAVFTGLLYALKRRIWKRVR